MKKTHLCSILLCAMVLCSCSNGKSTERNFDYEFELDTTSLIDASPIDTVATEADSALLSPNEISSKESAERTSSSVSSSNRHSRSDLQSEKGDDKTDNMRGFDPASEDDMHDNGVSRFMENDDDAGWD